MFDLIINQTKLLNQLGGIWVIALLIFSRTVAFASMAPLIGSKNLPGLVKIGFSMVLTLILIPTLEVPSEYPKGFNLIYLVVINACIGMLIGWLSGLVLEIGKTAGEMLDMQMGLNAATIFDPSTQAQTTIVGKLFDYLALVLFVTIGGMEKIIEGLYKSFNAFPVISYQFNFNFENILRATCNVIALSFLIASPIIMILLTVDLILGLMSRAAPQINAFQISFSIKPSISLLLLLILLPALLQIFATLFSNPLRFF